jgi:hypothetical protein
VPPNARALLSYRSGFLLIGFTMQPPDRPPMTFRKLLEILVAVAVLELGFFLFRLGATW